MPVKFKTRLFIWGGSYLPVFMIPCKRLLEFDLEMVSNFSENANILEYEIKFEKNLKACDWSV